MVCSSGLYPAQDGDIDVNASILPGGGKKINEADSGDKDKG